LRNWSKRQEPDRREKAQPVWAAPRRGFRS
jgi:hypothetical protein